MAELDGITVKVKAEVDDALLKLRAVRDAIKEIRGKTAEIRIKEEFNKGTKAVGDTTAAVKKLGTELRNADRDGNRFTSGFKTLFRDVNKGVKDINGGFLRNLGGGVEGFFRNLKRGFSDTWKAAKDVGKAVGGVFSALTGAGEEGLTVGKAFSQLGTSMLGVVGSAATMGPALLALVGILGAVLLPLGAMLSGLLAAAGALAAGAIGVGLLAAVAIPSIKNLQSSLSALSTATQNYSEASKNLNIGLKNSKQDMAQYQGVLKGVDPNLRSAVKLLRDSSVQWQNLSAAQKRNVVALSENKDALKNMSPAMKTALTALLAEKQAYDNLTPSQRKFASALSGVSREWHKVQAAAQPVLTLLLTDLTQLAKDVLPLVTPVINATGQAIHRLLVRADTFVKSEKFKQWVKNLTNEIPGVIRQVGDFIGKLTTLAGKLITNKKNTQDLHDVLTTFYNAVNSTITAINGLDNAFNRLKNAPIISFLSSINSKLSYMNGLAGAVGRALGQIANLIPGLGAVGRVVGGLLLGHETGTPGAPPGYAWTGERGPELVKFNGGETVIPHGPSMAMARGYANGTPGWERGGDMQPIVVNIDGKKLFEIMKNRTFGYNVANNKRTPGGSATGVMAV